MIKYYKPKSTVGIALCAKLFHVASHISVRNAYLLTSQFCSMSCGKVPQFEKPMRDRSGGYDAGLPRTYKFVRHATPADLPRNKGVHKVRRVQERDEHRQQDVYPALARNLGSPRWKSFHHTNQPERTSDRGKQYGKKSERHDMKCRPLLKEVFQD